MSEDFPKLNDCQHRSQGFFPGSGAGQAWEKALGTIERLSDRIQQILSNVDWLCSYISQNQPRLFQVGED